MWQKLTFSNVMFLTILGALPFLYLPTTTVNSHNHFDSNTIGDDHAQSDTSSAAIFKNTKFAETTQSIHPDNQWQKIEIDVSKLDLKNITHPFAFKITPAKGSEKVVLYLKYIIYDTQSAKNPVPTDNNSVA